MDNLWSPWRMEYIEQEKSQECIFCIGPTTDQDAQKQILYRGNLAYVIINRYPYNSGHLMVAPYRHLASLKDLEEKELWELSSLVRECEKILKEAYQPQGFNMGLNVGEIAGAGFAYHLHIHIVPRWLGDTNFMPIIAKAKALPELPEESYNRLLPFFQIGET